MTTMDNTQLHLAPQGVTTARNRFDYLDNARHGHLQIARQCAALTLPKVLPPEGFSSSEELPHPNQGIGAECVNKLGSKLTMTLFPPNMPFFRLKLDDLVLRSLVPPEILADTKAEVNSYLSLLERAAMALMSQYHWYTSLSSAVLSLVITGNALLVRDYDKKHMRYLRMDKWVVRRDALGDVVELLFKDTTESSVLTEELQSRIKSPPGVAVDLITWVKRNPDGTTFTSEQWINNVKLEDTVVTYDDARFLPFVAASWSLVSGEDYGRGLVEDYIGDFRGVEGLSLSIDEYIAAASRLVPLVNPAGVTDIERLQRARNGQFVVGRAEDVTFLSLANKAMDIQQAQGKFADTATRLHKAFLVVSGIQRQAERVTAEEIRMLSNELEDALGATYSQLAMALQSPVANLAIESVLETHRSAGTIAPAILGVLDDNLAQLEVATGTSGLGKAHEFQSFSLFLQTVMQAGEPVDLHPSRFKKRVASLLNLDVDEILKTDMEMQEEQQQAFAQEMALKATPNVTKGIIGQNQQQAQGAQPV